MRAVSIYEPVYDDADSKTQIIDTVQVNDTSEVIDKIFLKQLISTLSAKKGNLSCFGSSAIKHSRRLPKSWAYPRYRFQGSFPRRSRSCERRQNRHQLRKTAFGPFFYAFLFICSDQDYILSAFDHTKKEKRINKMVRYRILKCVLLSLLIVAVVMFIAHFSNTQEINKQTARLVFYENNKLT